MSAPTKLVVEYDDGSTRGVDFSRVGEAARRELAQLGLSPAGGPIGCSKHYLVMQWKDGWQEVVGVDKASVELLRYYVIERIEERGRLSLETGDEYPELYLVERTPRDLTGALIVGQDGLRAYILDTSVERWEGIFEAGGKREYVKFDSTSDKYPHQVRVTEGELGPLLAVSRRSWPPRAWMRRRFLPPQNPSGWLLTKPWPPPPTFAAAAGRRMSTGSWSCW